MPALAASPAERRPDTVVAASREEAVAAFGDGAGIAVVAGGTVVLPLVVHGRLRPARALLLLPSALGELSDGATLTVGATVTLARLAEAAPEPLASAARISDYEIRGQATVGGNLHVGGDLQPALIALGARVRSAGAGGGRVDPVEAYLASEEPRLVLAVEVERPLAGAYVEQRRRHGLGDTVVSVAVARREDGVRVAAGSLGAHVPAVRCAAVERALAAGAAPREAAQAAADDVEPRDDPLASAWYRARVLPVLVARALEQLEEVR
jgi:CO/xanthine dehydrogenase FAD-binding subunit